MIVCCCGVVAQGKYGGGSGTPEDPYQIWDPNDMQAIGADANDWGSHFILMADIDLGQFDGKDGREKFNLIGEFVGGEDPNNKPFTGVLDGNGHAISNFTYDSNDRDRVGLFVYVDDPNAEIRDLGLLDPNVNAGTGDYVGSLVGSMWDGNITNCYAVGGSVTGGHVVGGLVGYYDSGTMSNCYSTNSVTGRDDSEYTGGLCGWNDGRILNCYSTGNVTGNDRVGGLCGTNACFVSQCHSTGNITGNNRIGGLCGINSGAIKQSYSTGDVTGNSSVGGLCGYNIHGAIHNCYARGTVTGISYLGGLCGYGDSQITFGSIVNCYSTGTINDSTHGGLCGYNMYPNYVFNSFWDTQTSGAIASSGGIGLTTNKMKSIEHYRANNWGVTEVWTIDDGIDYPRLLWENAPGEVITNPYIEWSGSGTIEEPWEISSANDLAVVSSGTYFWDKSYVVVSDINSSGVFINKIGNENNNPFTGNFDGQKHIITNLELNLPDSDYVGLFGYLGNAAVIENLGLENVHITGNDYLGALCGRNYGSIANCYSTGTVTGVNSVSGLCGANHGSISKCYSTATVTGETAVAGLCGLNSYGSGITECYSTGSVTAVDSNSAASGLCGLNSTSISNCYSKGSVAAETFVSGLCLANFGGSISNCYSAVSVLAGDQVVGLVGYNENYGTIINSYWNTETSDPNMCASQEEGAIGCDPNYGKTTAEMHQQSTFEDWDFANVWNIGENQTYPYLRTVPAGDINKDRIVNFLDLCIIAEQWAHKE